MKASKDQKANDLPSSAVPTQPVANEPSQSRNEEVGAPLSESMHIRLPPKIESSGDRDSRYSSIASTPVSKSSIAVPVQSTPVKVNTSKNRKANDLLSSAVPTQPVANEISQSRDGMTIKQPPSHNHGVVGAHLHPPKAEPSGNDDSGYASFASTPVSNSHELSIDVPVRSTLVEVKASKDQKANDLPSSAVPTQPVANEPSQSKNEEVGAPLSEFMQLCLAVPPKAEPSGNDDSGYSSIASSPVSELSLDSSSDSNVDSLCSSNSDISLSAVDM